MRALFLSLGLLTLVSFNTFNYKESDEKALVNRTLDAWHKAAAVANFNSYFGMMTEDAIFIGTDPSENWNKKAFEVYAKPYFDKGKAWSFKALERHVYFDQ
jgi:ketosteroid isomerase-like protein